MVENDSFTHLIRRVRTGDAAEMALLELVDRPEKAQPEKGEKKE